MAEKLANCKTCGKEVAPTATKCPHCGQRLPATKMGVGCLVLIVLLVVGGFLESMCNKAPAANELPITFAQFEENFNSFGKTFTPSLSLSNVKIKPKEKEGEIATRQAKINEYASLVISESDSGRLVGVTMVGAGDGSAESGVAVLMAMAATMSGLDPTLTKKQRTDILQGVGLTDGRVFKSDQAISTAMNGIKYSSVLVPGMGLWFSAEKNI